MLWPPTRAPFEDEDAEARQVARRRLDAAAADLLAAAIEDPGRLLLHAGRHPDLFREVGRQGLLRRLAEQHADEVGLAGAVVPARARGRLARQSAHVAHQRVDAFLGRVLVEPRDVGVRVGVVLVPAHARGHRQQLADADVVVGRALHLRDVGADLVVHALDVAVADRRADERRGDRLGDRERRPAPAAVEAEAVALEAQLAVVDDEQGGAALARHVVVDVEPELAAAARPAAATARRPPARRATWPAPAADRARGTPHRAATGSRTGRRGWSAAPPGSRASRGPGWTSRPPPATTSAASTPSTIFLAFIAALPERADDGAS